MLKTLLGDGDTGRHQLHSPPKLLAQAGELGHRSKSSQHYHAVLLKQECSGGCNACPLPGWGKQPFSCSLAKVCKYRKLQHSPQPWLGLVGVSHHHIIPLLV